MEVMPIALDHMQANAVIYTTGRKSFSQGHNFGGGFRTSEIDKRLNIAKWFKESKNLEPNNIIATLLANNIAPAILDTKAKFIAGSGVITYQTDIVDGKKTNKLVSYAEIEDWMEESAINDVMFNTAKDYNFFGNAFFEGRYNKKKQIKDISHIDASTVRAEAMNASGIIPNYLVCGDWQKPKYNPEKISEGNVVKVKAFQKEVDAEALYPKYIYHVKDYTPGNPYYSLPTWYGSLMWIELANTIPAWHLSGINNGYALRYIIEVSESYFDRLQDQTKITEAKAKLQLDLENCLSGSENTSKSIYVTMKHSDFTEKGILKITPIETDLHDEAFSLLFSHSNTAITSGFAIDPTLCGIETDGKLSSGSEKRIAYELWLRLHAVKPRKQLLGVLDHVIKVNGWDKKYKGLKFGFENIQLTTLDQNPTGSQSAVI